MFHDRRGLPMTASSQAAVDAFDTTVDALLAAGRDAGLLLKQVAEFDPDMVMGQCLRGYFMRLPATAPLAAQSHEALARAEALAAGGTARERQHVAALAAWCAGDIRRTNRIWDEILLDHPHDILAMRLAHTMHFFIGDLAAMADSMARLMPRWDESLPGYGFVLGCRAFSLEENHDFAQAEPMGRRAVAINENDIWAGHCVAHVLEAQGRRRDGIVWIDAHQEAWRKRGIFANHMWWHRALHYLELERFDEVFAAYDREVWAQPSEDNIDICNATSTLMRLAILGFEVGDRWRPLADIAAGRVGVAHRLRPFNDMHFTMALAMDGRRDAARDLLASLRAAGEADGTLAPIYREVAVPVAEAILAYATGDHATVVARMLDVRHHMVPLGGSWAQRDVWLRMLIDSALRDGRDSLARALLAERTAACPTSAPSWTLYAGALARCGATSEAGAARARAAALLGI